MVVALLVHTDLLFSLSLSLSFSLSLSTNTDHLFSVSLSLSPSLSLARSLAHSLAYMYAYICVYIHVQIYRYRCIYRYIQMYIPIYIYIYQWAHVNTRWFIYISSIILIMLSKRHSHFVAVWGTAYCISSWRVISSFSDFNRWSSTLCLLTVCHVPLNETYAILIGDYKWMTLQMQ